MPAATPEELDFIANGPPPKPKPSSADSVDQSSKPGGQSGAPTGSQSGAPTGGQSGAPSGGQSGAPSGSQSGAPNGGQSGAPSGGKSGAPTGGQSGPPSGGKPRAKPYNPYSTCKGEGLQCAREIFDEMSSSKYKQVST